MRVLVVGKRGGILHWLENVMDGFTAIPDIEAKAFCVNHSDRFEQLWRNVVKKCSRHLLDQIIASRFAEELERFKPQLILVVDYFYIPQTVFEILSTKKKSAIVAWWIGDLFDRNLVTRHNCVDKFYFTDSYFLEYAAEAGIHNAGYLPLAYNPNIFRLLNTAPRNQHMVFVGAYTESRSKLLSELKEPTLVVGKRWNQMKPTHHDVRGCRVSINEVVEIYNRHMGVLNIKNSGNVVNGLNMRTFDAPACGCVVVNDHLKDIDKCFEVGKEILVYNSAEEMNEHTTRILNYKNERTTIADAGRRRVQAEHQYSHRIRSILNDLF